MKCPNCGNQTLEDAVFCDQCGQRLPRDVSQGEIASEPAASDASKTTVSPTSAPSAPSGTVCPSCGASTTPGEMFCDECGAPLEAPQPEPSDEGAPLHATLAQASSGTVEAEDGKATVVCPACGADVPVGDAFCFACGAALQAADRSEAPSPASSVGAVVEEGDVTATPSPDAVTAATSPTECPACGAQVGPDDAFCEFCGAALVGAAAAAPQTKSASVSPASTVPPEAAAIGARLVLVDSGVEFPIQGGKQTLVGREDPYSGIFPDIDLTPYGAEEAGVSRRHFCITATGEQYTIEDMNSTNFTMVNRQKLDPGKSVLLKDGDEIRAGRLRLRFKVGP